MFQYHNSSHGMLSVTFESHVQFLCYNQSVTSEVKAIAFDNGIDESRIEQIQVYEVTKAEDEPEIESKSSRKRKKTADEDQTPVSDE